MPWDSDLRSKPRSRTESALPATPSASSAMYRSIKRHRMCTPGTILPLPRYRARIRAMASRNLRQELLRLSTAEKIELVEELWDSIPECDEALALTPEQSADLSRRLADADADPEGGTPWEVVREQVRQRKR